nr:prickle planar cell polarity protein 3-like [Chelonoidis abingdonii]
MGGGGRGGKGVHRCGGSWRGESRWSGRSCHLTPPPVCPPPVWGLCSTVVCTPDTPCTELGLACKGSDWTSSSTSKLSVSPRLSQGLPLKGGGAAVGEGGFPRGATPRVSFREPLVAGKPGGARSAQLNRRRPRARPCSSFDNALHLAGEGEPEGGLPPEEQGQGQQRLVYSASEGAFPASHRCRYLRGRGGPWHDSSSSSSSDSEEEGYFLGEPIPVPPHLRGGASSPPTTEAGPPRQGGGKRRQGLRAARDRSCVVA